MNTECLCIPKEIVEDIGMGLGMFFSFVMAFILLIIAWAIFNVELLPKLKRRKHR